MPSQVSLAQHLAITSPMSLLVVGKKFEMIVIVFIYSQVLVEVIKYRGADKVMETVDEREVDYHK
jgi:hypothetical protein